RLGEIAVERRIVREEILDDLDEDGRQIDPDNVARIAMFGDHPLGFPITGPIAALDGFDEKRLRAHMAKYYVAANSVLSVAGACDPKEAFSLAQKHFGDMPTGAREVPLPWSTRKRIKRKHVASPGSQTDLRISYITPGERSAMGPAIELLLRCIDDGM